MKTSHVLIFALISQCKLRSSATSFKPVNNSCCAKCIGAIVYIATSSISELFKEKVNCFSVLC